MVTVQFIWPKRCLRDLIGTEEEQSRRSWRHAEPRVPTYIKTGTCPRHPWTWTPDLLRVMDLFERMGLATYEETTDPPASRHRKHPENASVALYSLPTSPDEIRHMGQATLFHGTTWKSLISFLLGGCRFSPSSGGGGETMITESCVGEDAIFTSKDIELAMTYATPCCFHDPKKTWVHEDPLIQDFRK